MNIKSSSIIALSLMILSALHSGDISGDGMQAGGAILAQSGTAAMPGGDDEIIVFKLAGDGQNAPAGQWTPASLEVGAWRESGPEPLINVPVDFSLISGGGWLAKTPDAGAGSNVQILTDIDGIAQVWHRQPDQADVQSIIAASALGKSVTFTTYSIAPADAATSGASPAPAESSTDTPPPTAPEETATKTPVAKPSLKSMLQSLATAQGARRASKSAQLGDASEPATKPALPDEYFAYPAAHPLGRMERGMILYAASCKARELRDTEQAVLLAAESKVWLTLALESEDGLDDASMSRCHYYLGRLAERYNGNQTAALEHYRVAGEKDATRQRATAAAARIELFKK